MKTDKQKIYEVICAKTFQDNRLKRCTSLEIKIITEMVYDLLATEPKEEKCKHCKGTGRIYDGNTHTWSGCTDCPDCLGSGKYKPKEIQPIEELKWEGEVKNQLDSCFKDIHDKINQLIRHYNLERKI